MGGIKRRTWQGMLGLALLGSIGCQTWVPEAGITMPSGRYLQHPPQYIPPSPDFPLERELNSLMEYNAQAGQFAPTPLPAQP